MKHTTHFDDCGCKSSKLTAEVARLREALDVVATDASCKCHRDYTRRGRHEPNALCHLADIARAARAPQSGDTK